MNKLSAKKISSVLFPCVFFYTWFVLVIMNGDLLYTIQDFSPWLGTHAYFIQTIAHPGGLREWIGDWLTQLFYYPWLGGSVMVLLWFVSAFFLSMACRLNETTRLLTLVPVLALLTTITQLGYWVFCLKTSSYWFGSTVGFFFLSLVSYIYSRTGIWGRTVTLSLWMLIGFPALGWMASLGVVVLILLTPFRQSPREWSILLIPFVIVTMAVLSYYSKDVDTNWRLPLLLYGFPHVIIPEASSTLLEVAPIVMSVSLVLMPLVGRVSEAHVMKQYGLLFCGVIVAASLYCANMLNYQNSNFHAELTMLRAMDEGRWDDLLQTMRQIERKPTREMVMMKDVALAQKGKLHESAFAYDIRGVNPAMVVNLPIHMNHSAAPTIYYWLGMPNYAYYWSMENYIEYGLSPHWLRLFYRSAVVNGEREVALKYKRLLQTTLFHGDLEVSEEECQSVRRFMTGHNVLDNDGGFAEIMLMQTLSKEEYDTVEGQEIALHYSMLMRDSDAFMKALDRYVDLVGRDEQLSVLYQQALILFGSFLAENDSSVLDSLPISKEVRDLFERYRSDLSFSVGQPLLTDVIGERYYARYGHTYWWYYDFYTNNKTY